MTEKNTSDHNRTEPRRTHKLRRALIDVGIALALGGACVGVYYHGEHACAVALAAQQARADVRLSALRAEGGAWGESIARGRAEAVFRAYAAGIHAAVLADRKESLDQSVAELVRLPGVVFVHLLRADGAVVVSSDRKLVLTGKASERGAWALGATEFKTRPGDLSGTTELALPIDDAAGVRAILWMAYDTTPVLERGRPTAFAPAAAAAGSQQGGAPTAR